MSENRRRRNNGAQNTQVKKARTNNARRILLLVGLMSLVAVISIGGTIAWLTAETAPVVNTFTYGDINITLDETTGDDYKIVPGNDLSKDPKVTVTANSEACWLFVKVTERNWPQYTEIDETTNKEIKKVKYEIDDGWTALDGESGVYYRQVPASTAAQDFPVLKDNKVVVSSNLTKTEVNSITGNSTLTFKAYACQQDNVSTAADAWAKLNPSTTTNP